MDPSSPRLVYRRLRAEDADVFHALVCDPYVRHFLMDGESMTRAWVDAELAASAAAFARGGVGLWLVSREGESPPVGFCGFRVFPEVTGASELVFALLEPHAGQGLATEMGRAAIGYARDEAGWSTLESAVDAPNVASRRVLEKLGFVRTGEVPGAFGEIFVYRLGVEARLTIAGLWNGESVAPPHAEVRLSFGLDALTIEVDAPGGDDPAPAVPPGPTPRLWEHEVVEVFLLGEGEQYLEIELGPHGHHLVLELHGRRRMVRDRLAIDYAVRSRGDGRWQAVARVPSVLLPPGLERLNACAIQGVGEARRYYSWQALGGPAPDFHRLEGFAPLRAVLGARAA